MTSKFLEDVVSTSDEKKAPPYMERLQREHCIVGQIQSKHLTHLYFFCILFELVENQRILVILLAVVFFDPATVIFA